MARVDQSPWLCVVSRPVLTGTSGSRACTCRRCSSRTGRTSRSGQARVRLAPGSPGRGAGIADHPGSASDTSLHRLGSRPPGRGRGCRTPRRDRRRSPPRTCSPRRSLRRCNSCHPSRPRSRGRKRIPGPRRRARLPHGGPCTSARGASARGASSGVHSRRRSRRAEPRTPRVVGNPVQCTPGPRRPPSLPCTSGSRPRGVPAVRAPNRAINVRDTARAHFVSARNAVESTADDFPRGAEPHVADLAL